MTDGINPADFIQYVTLDNVEQAAVFVAPVAGDDEFPDTRVFYDLDSLIGNMRMVVAPQVLAARLRDDEQALTNLAGAVWLIDNIVAAKEAILLEAQFALPDAEK